jgi:ABC-type sugar transport system ATPase subunit
LVDITSDNSFLVAEGLWKRYGHIQALRDVSLAVGRGQVLGLCGHNGAGKSTLVKILAGLERPDAGKITIGQREVRIGNGREAQACGVAVIDQALSVVPALTVADNLFLGSINHPFVSLQRRRYAMAEDLLDRVGLSGVDPATIAGTLRIGERQLVELARLLARDAQLLILDEPTASLSETEAQRVFAAIRAAIAHRRSVIYVSHRIDEVLRICDSVIVLRDGQCVAHEHVEKLDRRALIKLMVGEHHQAAFSPPKQRERATTLRINHLVVPGRVQDFSLDCSAGEIVGLAGQVGAGGTEILRSLGGLISEVSGNMLVAGKRLAFSSPRRAAQFGVVYVSGDRLREGLFPRQSISENLTATRLHGVSCLGVILERRRSAMAQALSKLLGLDSRRLWSRANELSGGNQQKVLIGRSLDRADARVLLLDDPTQGVDVRGRAEIHRLIRRASTSGAVVLFTSTELDELIELSDRIVTMFRGRMVSVRRSEEADAGSILADMTHAAGSR